MPHSFRALVARTTGHPGGAVIHVIREGDAATMCRAFPAAKLSPCGALDEQLCSECISAIVELGRSLQRVVSGERRFPFPRK